MRFGKLVCLGLLVAACGIVPGVASARGGMHGDSGTLSRQLLHALSLTDDQQAQVREAFGTYRTTVQPLWQEMRATRQHLQDVLVNPTGLDSAALQTAQQHLAGLQADVLLVRAARPGLDAGALRHYIPNACKEGGKTAEGQWQERYSRLPPGAVSDPQSPLEGVWGWQESAARAERSGAGAFRRVPPGGR